MVDASLGPHLVAALLRRYDLIFERLVAVTAAQAAGVVCLDGRAMGVSLAVAGLVMQVALCLRLAVCRTRRRELCVQLTVGGRERLPLACVERKRRRLLDPRASRELAKWIDELLAVAADPTRTAVGTYPYGFRVEQLRQELGRARCLPSVER